MRRVAATIACAIVFGGCSGETSIPLEFTGTDCVADLPDSITAGNHTFSLTNPTELTSLPVYVARLSDGRSYEEFAALQGAPGDYFTLPAWADFALRNFDDQEPGTDDRRRFTFTLEPGQYAVYLWASRPAAIWLCGPLAAVAEGEGR